ncbi:MAG: hypothetical protein HYZ81_02555 [Nitrospinae bacterium]|nr:hypothetical protein [Nitrospinota bacterium]
MASAAVPIDLVLFPIGYTRWFLSNASDLLRQRGESLYRDGQTEAATLVVRWGINIRIA